MSWLASARNYAAFGRAIPKYVREQREHLTLEDAQDQIKSRLQTREQRFLEMVDHCIYGHPESPYLPLLKAAGCEQGDVRDLVQNEGLEPALRRLRDEGVYFSFEEFKGRQPVERRGVAFTTRAEDFDNPTTARHYWMATGGSTGPQTRVWMSLSGDRWGAHRLVGNAAHGLLDAPFAKWGPGEPSSVAGSMRRALTGERVERWFATGGGRGHKDAFMYGLASKLIVLAALSGGMRLPKREWLDPDDALPVARWAEEKLRSNGKCLIHSTVSKGVRLAIAAAENHIDLHGAALSGGGEPATPGKVKAIARSGAKWIGNYIFAEGGRVGFGCANPIDGSDVHFLSDRLGLIENTRTVPGTGLSVKAFCFTALSDAARKILLNVEIDDFGILERRECGCLLGEVGYDQHIREIYSFQKLTGEGVTLVGGDLVRILEEVLPPRFGGSPLDYQLVEEEDENHLTRLSLVIDPRVQIEDEAQVIATVLKELKATDAPSSMAGTIWAQSGTFRIKRMRPLTSSWREKLLPLHVSRGKSSARL